MNVLLALLLGVAVLAASAGVLVGFIVLLRRNMEAREERRFNEELDRILRGRGTDG